MSNAQDWANGPGLGVMRLVPVVLGAGAVLVAVFVVEHWWPVVLSFVVVRGYCYWLYEIPWMRARDAD